MNVAIYARYSSDNQREESITAQIRAMEIFSQDNGYNIIATYTDEARSATTDNRPGFLRMVKDSAKGHFQAVLVHKLDRFSRDRYDSAYYKRELRKNGVVLISVLERLDDSPESIILEGLLKAMAEYYSRNLAREVMKGMTETALQGKHVGGIPPLGYDVGEDKRYIINEVEADAVRLIFNMYASGRGYSPIIDELNRRGYKTKTGRSYGKNSLHDILCNEKYIGNFVFNRSASKDINNRHNSHTFKDEKGIIRLEGKLPAIIERPLWERVRAKMENNKHARGANKAKTVYILSGHIFCGKCGGAMVGKAMTGGRNKARYSYYECARRKQTRDCDKKPINKDKIEQYVIGYLYDKMFSPNSRVRLVEQISLLSSENRQRIPADLKQYRKQLSEVEVEIKNIVDAIAAGMFHDSMKDRMTDLEAQKATLSIRIKEGERQKEIAAIPQKNIEAYLKQWEDIKTAPPEKQKEAVSLFIDKVTIFDDHIDVDLGDANAQSFEISL